MYWARRQAISIINRLVDLAVFHPKVVLAIWFLLLLGAVGGISRVVIETSGESILDKADPAWGEYQRSLALFGNDEVIVAALLGHVPYEASTLRLVRDASRVLESIPGVRRVDSVSTLPIIEVVDEDELRLDPALEGNGAIDDRVRAEVGRRIAGSRIASRNIASADGRAIAINIWPEAGIERSYESLIEQVRRIVGSPVALVSGVPVFRTEVNLRTRHELGVFVPITLAVMVFLLAFAFRSARAVVVPLTVSGVSVVLLGGFMGWAGIPLSAPTMILPPVLLAVGSAYTMHLLLEVREARGAADLTHAIKNVARPIVLSGLTTVIGFASTAIVPIEAVQRVGLLGALGTAICCVASIGLAGAIISLWHGGMRRNELLDSLRDRLSPSVFRWVRTYDAQVIAAWAAVFAVGAFGVQRLQVESDVVVWFPRGNEVRDAYEGIKEHLSGISPINVVIDGMGDRKVSEPNAIAAIDSLSHYLSSLQDVGRVISVADAIRDLHHGFTDGQNGALPNDQATIEQYLLLLEGTDRLEDVVTNDRRSANVLIRVNDNGSQNLLQVAQSAENWWRDNGAFGFSARSTGSMFEIARAEEAIAHGQAQSLGLDVVVIALVLLLALGGLRLAFLALMPNVLPVALMFGFMGFAGISLDLGTVFVSNLAVGIAVDETIHLVAAFNRYRDVGLSANQCVERAMRTVVPALVLTTVVIAAGFLVLALSEFRFTRNLGLLTAAVMFLCVASNLTLLPALLLKFNDSTARQVQPGSLSA